MTIRLPTGEVLSTSMWDGHVPGEDEDDEEARRQDEEARKARDAAPE